MEYILLIVGFILLIKGADFFVDGASSVAAKLKVPSLIIGLTVVSMGTSLPELVTSIVAARKGDSGIAMGNVVGSNIFNILFILGMAGVIKPMTADAAFFIDTGILIGVALIMLLFFAKNIRKTQGIAPRAFPSVTTPVCALARNDRFFDTLNRPGSTGAVMISLQSLQPFLPLPGHARPWS